MTTSWEVRTEDAEAPFLDSAFWQEGTQIRGVVAKWFKTKLNDDPCYVLDLENPVELNGVEEDRVSVGNLAGLKMCYQVAGRMLQVKDIVELECTGKKPAKKEGFSDRLNFRLKVVRP